MSGEHAHMVSVTLLLKDICKHLQGMIDIREQKYEMRSFNVFGCQRILGRKASAAEVFC